MDDLKIDETLFRNVDQVLPSKEFLLSQIKTGKNLKIYHGIDPTADTLHIGHLSALKKMKHFQEIGFEVIILMGGMTATIGDPAGKSKVRNQLSVAEVFENIQKIKTQIEKVLNFAGENPAKILNNYDWLSKLNFEEILKISSMITHEQMIERDMFQERIKNHEPIFMHEFMYPLMQGYDSVALDVDCELGGSDQLFNMMMGRTLLKKIKDKEKFVITIPLLTDSNGKKIGKSEGNVIPFGNNNPYDTFTGIMTLGDDVIVKCFVSITDLSLEEISIIETDIEKNNANPMVYKKLLAFTVVKEVYGEEEAKKCQEEFERTVQNKEFSEDQIKEIALGPYNSIYEFLKESLKQEFSNSEIKKVIEQNGLEINGNKVNNFNQEIKVGDEIKFGKRIFIKII
jgi:tyrosyl-tRNA synthetase